MVSANIYHSDEARVTEPVEAVARQQASYSRNGATAAAQDALQNSDSVSRKSVTSRNNEEKQNSPLQRVVHSHSHSQKDHCINSFLKILSISSSHTNGHPAVVPMVTALNHAVADGGRAGGLNLSSSILSDY